MRKPFKEQTPPWHLLIVGNAIITAFVVALIQIGPVFADHNSTGRVPTDVLAVSIIAIVLFAWYRVLKGSK